MEKVVQKFKVLKEFWIKDVETGFMRITKTDEEMELPNDVVFGLLEAEKITPVGMPEKAEYIVVRGSSFKTADNKLVSLNPEDVVVLERGEALRMMLQGLVRPRDPWAFHPKPDATISYGAFGYTKANQPLKKSWVRGR